MGHVFIFGTLVLRGDNGIVSAHGEFRRMVGLGRLLDSGLRSTKLGGGHEHSSVSACFQSCGTVRLWARYRDCHVCDRIIRWRRRNSARGTLMMKRTMKTVCIRGNAPRGTEVFGDEGGGMEDDWA